MNYKPPKVNQYKRDTKNFDRENFFLDLLSIDWQDILQLEKEDPNLSFQQYLTTINTLIDKYMPLKKMSRKEIKQQYKPWVTKNILQTIKERESLHRKFINAKDLAIKADYHTKYKKLRTKVLDDMKENKKLYFQEFFSKNAKNMKSTWNGIKSIINVKRKKKNHPNSLILVMISHIS